jgi:hypothetical protein
LYLNDFHGLDYTGPRRGAKFSRRARTIPDWLPLASQRLSEFEPHARAILGLPVEPKKSAFD